MRLFVLCTFTLRTESVPSQSLNALCRPSPPLYSQVKYPQPYGVLKFLKTLLTCPVCSGDSLFARLMSLLEISIAACSNGVKQMTDNWDITKTELCFSCIYYLTVFIIPAEQHSGGTVKGLRTEYGHMLLPAYFPQILTVLFCATLWISSPSVF